MLTKIPKPLLCRKPDLQMTVDHSFKYLSFQVSLGLRIQVLFGPACIDPCILRISVRDGSVLHSESQH